MEEPGDPAGGWEWRWVEGWALSLSFSGKYVLRIRGTGCYKTHVQAINSARRPGPMGDSRSEPVGPLSPGPRRTGSHGQPGHAAPLQEGEAFWTAVLWTHAAVRARVVLILALQASVSCLGLSEARFAPQGAGWQGCLWEPSKLHCGLAEWRAEGKQMLAVFKQTSIS